MGKDNRAEHGFRKENILDLPRPQFPKRAVITGGVP